MPARKRFLKKEEGNVTCVRLVSVRAHEGSEAEVHRLFGEIGTHQQGLPGFMLALRFVSPTDPNEIVGMTVWDTREHADEHAQDQHIVALMSHLRASSDENPITGDLFEVVIVRGELPAPVPG